MAFWKKLLRKPEIEKRQPTIVAAIESHSRQTNDKVERLGDSLYIGMPFNDIVDVLGEPSGVNPGTEMLEADEVVASGEIRSLLEHTSYCMWKRPEGTYLLVIEYGKLARIHAKPEVK